MRKEGHVLLTAAAIVAAYVAVAVRDLWAWRRRERTAALLDEVYAEGYIQGLRHPPQPPPPLRPVE